MIKKHIPFLSIIMLLALAGCSALSSADVKSQYPQQPEDIMRNRSGSIAGDDGFKLFDGSKKDSDKSSTGISGIGINSYLWRASLDTLAFMPLASADPFGGVIITDWYEDPEVKGERFKVNVLILSKNLRSDSIKITVFKQSLQKKIWRDSSINEKVAVDLENKILTRARELRVEKESK